MLPKKIAFVDIETTGTSPNYDRVIEVGVLRVEDNILVDTYKTLVNPQSYLPEEIVRMTGITDRDLERAPTFRQIKKDLQAILADCIFTAHNARFDYGFLKNEFKRQGLTFQAKNLCTVKLSKHLFPALAHHNLDSLINEFHLECDNRHRAFDDAAVLWQFYQYAQKCFSTEVLDTTLDKLLKKPSTPPNLDPDMLDKLPEGPGVYIFYGHEGMPLYVGKSVNVKERVCSHFSGDHQNSKEMKISQQVESNETISTNGELGALFREAQLVKKLQPLYNQQLRNARKMVICKSVKNPAGYETVVLEDCADLDVSSIDGVLGIFKSRKQAKTVLSELAKKYELCDRLLGLESGKSACFGYSLGRCHGACLEKESKETYNARFAMAFAQNKISPWPFDKAIAIEEKDPIAGSVEAHIIDHWCYLGSVLYDDEAVKPKLSDKLTFDLDMYKILKRFFTTTRNQGSIKKLTPRDLSLLYAQTR